MANPYGPAMKGMSDLGAVSCLRLAVLVWGILRDYLSPTTKPPDIAPGVFL